MNKPIRRFKPKQKYEPHPVSTDKPWYPRKSEHEVFTAKQFVLVQNDDGEHVPQLNYGY